MVHADTPHDSAKASQNAALARRLGRLLLLGFAPALLALALFVAFVTATRPIPFEQAARLCADLQEDLDCSTAIAGGRARAYCLRMTDRGPVLPEIECEVLAGQRGHWSRPEPGQVEQIRLAVLQGPNPDWAVKARRVLSGVGPCRQSAIDEALARLAEPVDGYWRCQAGGRTVALQVLPAPPAWESAGAGAEGEVSPLIEISVMRRQ
jgi:hypothetical protein